jgi:hypothetical protein
LLSGNSLVFKAINGHVSRVYTTKSVIDCAEKTARYCGIFLAALPETRIAFEELPNPASSLLDLLLSIFGTSDPYTPEEVTIAGSWTAWDAWRKVDSKLHIIPIAFKAKWLPPKAWIRWKIQNDPNFLGPLPQSSNRIRVTGRFRKRLRG